MMREILTAILRANLILGVAVLAVLLLRVPFRRLFGAELAETLWAAPPLATLANLLPARTILGASSHPFADAVADVSTEGTAIWAPGVAAAPAPAHLPALGRPEGQAYVGDAHNLAGAAGLVRAE